MNDDPLIAELRRLMLTVDARYHEIATLSRTGATTIQLALATGQLPKRFDARSRITRFLAANRDARAITDLRFTG